jgi:CRISP-associated protein Cas1
MKKYLNTLYITKEGAYVHKERETVVVEVERKKVLQLPIHTIGNFFCFGNIMVSPQFMAFCSKNGAGLAFFSTYGKFLARVQGPISGNVLLRREQYRRSDNPDKTLDIVKNIVGAKVASTRTSLQRTLRNYPDIKEKDRIAAVVSKLKFILQQINIGASIDIVRGYEGEAAALYFSVFDALILKMKDKFYLQGRNRRPPRDNVNALLSFLYTIVLQDCVSACEGVGLDPAVGFLHRDRPGRPGLALDLLEEFRAYIADRLVLNMINLRQISAKGLISTESGAVRMDDETRKKVLTSYQERKQEEITHPFLKEKIKIGLVFHVQAMLMSRFIRRDIDFYPPFIWK